MYTGICPGLSGRIILAYLALLLTGCATYSQQAVTMRDNLLTGRVDLARHCLLYTSDAADE